MSRVFSMSAMLVLAFSVRGADMVQIPADNLEELSAGLVGLTSKLEKLPMKLTLDPTGARGLVTEDQTAGLILIPVKGLKEDRENTALGEGKGMPIGILYLNNLLPGDLKDKKKLFTFKMADPTGNEREIRLGVLTVRKFDDADFRLQLWGEEEKPLAESAFDEDPTDNKAVIELDSKADDVQVLLFGKYPSLMPVKAANY